MLGVVVAFKYHSTLLPYGGRADDVKLDIGIFSKYRGLHDALLGVRMALAGVESMKLARA